MLFRSIVVSLCALSLGTNVFAAADQSRGWGSSWTTPHSAQEREARDLDEEMRKALKNEDWTAVARILEEGRKLNPNSLQLTYASALVAMKRQHYADATAAYSRMLTLPSARSSASLSSEIYTERAYTEALQNSYQSARADLERAIALDKTNLRAHNNYAWLLATCPEASVRDGQRALTFARSLNQRLNSNNASALDTLAAAQAETGDFRGAIKTQQRAVSAAKAESRGVYQQHLTSYQNGQPVHTAPDRPAIKINTKF